MASAARGRTPAPPALRLLNGRGTDADGNNLDSAGRVIPKPPNFARIPPTKPDDLDGDAAWLWDQVTEQMGRLELLKPLDAASLEVVCETYARWKGAVRMRRKAGAIGQNSQGVVVAAWTKVEETAGREFRAWCAEYGLTPAGENKIAGGGAVVDLDQNPFE